MRIGADDEKIWIGAQPLCLERPSVATCVSAQPRGGGQCAMQRERARNTQTALRSGGAARRRPNDLIGGDRAASDPTIPSRCFGRGARGPAADAFQGEDGLAHKRRPIYRGRSGGDRRSPPRRHSIHSLRA